MMTVVTLALAITVGARDPIPPRQTPLQKQMMAGWQSQAKQLSDAAASHVAAYLDTTEFRRELGICCPQIANESASSLFRRIIDEFQTAELIHSFQPQGSNTTVSDTTLDAEKDAAIFYNIWEYALRLNQTVLNATSIAEEGILRFPAFTGPDDMPANVSEAQGRPIYSAMNIRGVDIGNPAFGTITAVYRRDYAKDMVVVSPVDTGLW